MLYSKNKNNRKEFDTVRFLKSTPHGCKVIVLSFIFMLLPSLAKAELYFNPNFLSDDPSAVADLSAFENGQEVPEGTYRVDVYLNDNYLYTRDVKFDAYGKQKELSPCFSISNLEKMDVNVYAIKDINKISTDTCHPLKELINDSTSKFDVGLQKLYITIPQVFIKSNARDFISPEFWDSGITAAMLNYSLNGNTYRNQNGQNSSYTYLNLNSGINLGPWRLRDTSAWTTYSGYGNRENKWEHINTYLERGINEFRSRLIVGDSSTANDIFDSISFRGIEMATDDNMLPDSQRGFAPVIRGVARTTANISITQNGYQIYHNTFAPGPFVIDDLYGGNGGDLNVTITESDGSIQRFSVPYASVPLLQREGRTKYALNVGSFRSPSDLQEDPNFFQGTILRGLSHGVTLYGGLQFTNKYQSFNTGIGKDLGSIGALTFDITDAKSKLPDDSTHQGQSIRFLYTKSMRDIGTTIQLAGYRYSTKGYYSLADTTYKRMDGYDVVTQDGIMEVTPKFTDYYNLSYSKRQKVQVSINQQISDIASLYITGMNEKYWNTGKEDQQLQIGFNSLFKGVSFGLSYSVSKNAWQDENDQSLGLSMSVPFSYWLRSDSKSIWRNANASYNVSHDLKGRVDNTAGLYGTLLDDNNLSYSVQTGYSSGRGQKSSSTGYTSLNYRGTYGSSNVGYSHSTYGNQVYYGLSGGVLAHADGVTLSQPMNDTVVLVKASGAKNVKIENQTGIKTDWRGYAVLPYATNYKENRIALNTNSLENNIELDDPVVNVIPTKGAVVRATFTPKIGTKALMKVTKNGKPLPFGTIVSLIGSNSSSIVADDGEVYLTGLPITGQLIAQWGKESSDQCKINYNLPEQSAKDMLTRYSATCL